MGFKCGIVGLPNVGKSTLFNALTRSQIEAANFPFCTIEPNTGRVPVPDPRLKALAEIVKPHRVVPTMMDFVDIAGLVKGASQGEGLGNQFLGHIREVDAILHVVRGFDSKDIIHVEGRLDPLADVDIVSLELALADLEQAERYLKRWQKHAKSGDAQAKRLIQLLEALIIPALCEGTCLRALSLNEEQQTALAPLNFITTKPILYVLNTDENNKLSPPGLERLLAQVQRERTELLSISAAFEAELSQLPADEQEEFLAVASLSEPGLHRLIRAGNQLLGRQTYFTAGVQEVRAWSIAIGDTAPQAAAKIHTDFEKGFIRAEVVAYSDFIQHSGFSGAKEAGKWRLEGKTYRVQEGDIMHFRFNV